MQYKDLGLKINNDIISFKFGDKEIKVKKYLPVEDKYDIAMITLQKSAENGIFNPIKLDIFYHLNLIYAYTDLEFSAEDREDELKLFDELESSGFMDEFLKVIDENEYKSILENIGDLEWSLTDYNKSAASVFKSFIEDLPANAEAAQAIVDNFDPSKYQAVVDFAKAANGNRPI
jgi:hypothetical protein